MPALSALGIGSGMDLNGLLSQLEKVEKTRLMPVYEQMDRADAEISAFGKLKSALSKFQDAAADLAEPEVFHAVSKDVSGDGVSASVEDGALTGTYDITVSQRAKAQSVAAAGIAPDSTLDAGTLNLEIGTGAEASSIAVDIAAGDSLADLSEKVNAEEPGIRASVIQDDTGQDRLVFSAAETGTDAALRSVSYDLDAGGQDARFSFAAAYDAGTGSMAQSGGSMTQTVAAENALATVNGIGVTGQTNTLSDVIEGVSVTLKEEGPDSSTITVSRDDGEVKDRINSFVDSYNALQDKIDTLGKSGTVDTSGPLSGNSTLRTVASRVTSSMIEGVEGSAISSLSELGITLNLEGKLDVDDDVLTEQVETNSSAIASFFSSENGLAKRLDDRLEVMLGDEGSLGLATEGLESRMDRLETREERLNQSISQEIEMQRKKFQRLDGIIAEMQSVQQGLTSQLSAISSFSYSRD